MTMKTLALVLFAALFVGCDIPKDETRVLLQEDVLHVVEYDGCEYVVWRARNSFNAGAITHKGNCKNPIHTKSRQ